MTFLAFLCEKTLTLVFLMFADGGSISFGVYDIKKSLTPLGWAVVFVLSLVLIFGLTYFVVKVFKNLKLK